MDYYDWEFSYVLSNKIPLLDEIVNSNDIKFKVIEEKSKTDEKIIIKKITGFTIKLFNLSEDDAQNLSTRKAYNLTHLLIIKSGFHNDSFCNESQQIKKDGKRTVTGSFRISYEIEGGIKNLNLNDENIKQIINSNEIDGLNYEYISNAISYRYIGKYSLCFVSLFKVIEDNKIPVENRKKYDSLRHVLIHKPPYHFDTIKNFNQFFGSTFFKYKKYDPTGRYIIIDLYDNKSKKSMLQVCNELLSIIKKQMDSTIFKK